jgi:hypothetical protein
MIEPSDRAAVRALIAITGVLALIFSGFMLIALNEEPGIAVGLAGGAVFGAIAASTFWIARSRRRMFGSEDTPSSGFRALASRLAQLEDERDIVTQLEERVDFAERLLAEQRKPGPAPLPGQRMEAE